MFSIDNIDELRRRDDTDKAFFADFPKGTHPFGPSFTGHYWLQMASKLSYTVVHVFAH